MTVRFQHLLFGNRGIEQTIRKIWAFILGYDPEHSFSETIPTFRRQAESILREFQVQRAPNALQAAAIYTWVQRRMAYVGDHLLVEEIRSPMFLLDSMESEGDAMGDCDDFVILMGALFAAVGIPFDLVAISSLPDGEFEHLFYLVHTSRGPITADAITGEPFGWHVPGFDPFTLEFSDPITNLKVFPQPDSFEALGINPLEGSMR